MTTTNARWFQLWKNEKGNLVNEKGKVLEIQGHRDRENQNIGVLEKDNGLYQQWEVIYVDEMPKELKKGDTNTMFGLDVERPFFVVTTLESERYVDLIGNNMVIKTPNSFESQLWYFDQKSRTIKSMRSKNMSWDIAGNSKGTNMAVAATNSYEGQLFKWDGESGFVNMYDGRALDVQGGKDEEGNNVQAYKPNGSPAQKWKLLYADKAKPVQMKGLNKKFGLHVNRPFFIVSKMWMNRVAECVGASNIVLKTLVRTNKGQQFYFDGGTKTIKSNQWKDRSITLSGKNLYMTGTNARWF